MLQQAGRRGEKQRLLAVIRKCAETLGKVPSQFELGKTMGITRPEIQKHFANYGLALRECGLEPAGARQNLETLFVDWARITRELGRTPTAGEYSMRSQFGEHPLRRRFGGWRAATQGMLLYAKEKGREDELAGITETAAEGKQPGDTAMSDECISLLTSNRLSYGESLNPLPMAHGPRNETGVVFAFGMLAKELGFVIQSMQTAFPDCEALRRVDGGWWQRVRIEIEYQSLNFLKHRHDPKGCDLIVCWEHNWPECPVEVLELRKAIFAADQRR
jgi:hypothetical protein